MLEEMSTAAVGGHSFFVTLTYNKENLPSDLSVHPQHLQLWLKRCRKRLTGYSLRFYGVGEYGDKSWRPHYHAAIFVVPHQSVKPDWSFVDEQLCEAWQGKGFVHIGTLTQASAGYIGGYVTKKMTKKEDERLNGRKPEFARMSLRPGIGALAAPYLVDILKKYGVTEIPKSYSMVSQSFLSGDTLRQLSAELFVPQRLYLKLEDTMRVRKHGKRQPLNSSKRKCWLCAKISQMLRKRKVKSSYR